MIIEVENSISGDIWLLFLVEKLGLSDVVKVVTLVLRRDIIAARSSSAEKYSTWRTPRKPPKQRSLPTTTTATRTTSYFVFFEAMAPLQYIQHFDAGIPLSLLSNTLSPNLEPFRAAYILLLLAAGRLFGIFRWTKIPKLVVPSAIRKP